MEWVLLVFGLFIGAAGGDGVAGAVLGALVGFVIGQSLRLRDVRRENAELRKQIEQFSARFDKGNEVVWQRLLDIERAVKASAARAPAADETAAATASQAEAAEAVPAPLAQPVPATTQPIDAAVEPAAAETIEPISEEAVDEFVRSIAEVETAQATAEPLPAAPVPEAVAGPASDIAATQADVEPVSETAVPQAVPESVADAPVPDAAAAPIPEAVEPAVSATQAADAGGPAGEPSAIEASSAAASAAGSRAAERASTFTRVEPQEPTKTAPAKAEPPKAEPALPRREPAKAIDPAVLERAFDAGPSIVERAFAAARDWLFGGNTVLRVGVLLLFLGLAFLLRYASERVSVPVELRYIGVALAAIVLLGIGWRLRLRRPAYALIVQGTGVAVLYLTVFAAMRLHPLISPQMAFVLLVVVTICSAILAILQDALGLAVVAALGGFSAPILTSTGEGNHVALFSYFTLLNAGIFAIAWFKAWRKLNLVGFIGTFGIGSAWGLRSYTPELFASTEPFLLVFFLMYVAIGLLFAQRKLREANEAPDGTSRGAMLRWSARQTDYVDGTVFFGTPLVGFALQYAVIRHIEFGVAYSALALGLFYMGLARLLARRAADRALLLIETCLALGVVFGTLAIPLAFDARWTSAAWAVEGAGLYWLGLRQRRRLARAFALFLQAAAAVIYLSKLAPGAATLIDGVPLGALMLGAAMLCSYLLLRRTDDARLAGWEPSCRPVLACVGLAFLYLIAPLCFAEQGTAIAWALAGLATTAVGLYLPSQSFRACALLIQAGAGMLYVTSLGPGAETLIDGKPLAALMLGLALLGSYLLLRRGDSTRFAAWEPSFRPALACFGLGFLYLIAPQCFGVEGTTNAWALAGLATVICGLYLGSRSFRCCAFAVLAGGGLVLLSSLQPGDATVLDGVPLSALVVGVSALASYLLLRRIDDARLAGWEPSSRPVLACAGLGFLYLIAPLCFGVQGTTIAWALAGLATIIAGLRLRAGSFLCCAFVIQLLAGLLFALKLPGAGDASVALAGGWQALISASVLGFTLIACVVLAMRDPYVRERESMVAAGLSTAVLVGLAFLNLAVLFVLPWRIASGVWGGSGLLVLVIGLRIRHQTSFFFGLGLLFFSGLSFMANNPDLFSAMTSEGLTPLAHAGFWTPMVLALAAIAGAWRLHRAVARGEALSAFNLELLASVLVCWGVVWWAIAALGEIVRFVPAEMREHALVLAAAASVALWMLLAWRAAWRTLALLCMTLVPVGLLALASAWNSLYQPFAQLGWLAWPALACVHLLSLACLRRHLPDFVVSTAHVVGCWLILAVPALGVRHALLTLADYYNAWRWLGLALVPSLFLAAMGSQRKWPWPVAAFEREYRGIAALPVAAILLLWFGFANFTSSGAAAPLPYLPLVNPLEIGLLIVLVAADRWLLHGLPALLPDAVPSPRQRQAFVGVLLFALLTMAVCRTAHHWAGIPFEAADLLRSIVVQAAFSIVWALIALGLMIAGHMRTRRDLWVVGATLISVVVIKLFLVELGDSGSLGRIISFIGVGVLMLVVGYFAPLPPKRQAPQPETQNA